MSAPWIDICLTINLACTLYMVGLIWFVQVVHYPLMAKVGVQGYETYQQAHMRLTTWVVGTTDATRSRHSPRSRSIAPDGRTTEPRMRARSAFSSWFGSRPPCSQYRLTSVCYKPSAQKLTAASSKQIGCVRLAGQYAP